MLTPYRVIKMLNASYDCDYPTQMGYNYVRNNLIPATDGKISEADADAWIAKFAANNNLVPR